MFAGLLVEHAPEILVLRNIGIELVAGGRALVVGIGEGDDVLGLAAGDIAAALSARADGGDVELFVGRFVAQVPQGWGAAEAAGRHCRRQQGPEEEVPSRSSVVGHVDSINPGAANRYNLCMYSPTRRDLLAGSALLFARRLRRASARRPQTRHHHRRNRRRCPHRRQIPPTVQSPLGGDPQYLGPLQYGAADGEDPRSRRRSSTITAYASPSKAPDFSRFPCRPIRRRGRRSSTRNGRY